MNGKQIINLMRINKITIRQLAARMGITIKRIREVRKSGITHLYTIRDWKQGITGVDPGPQSA